MKPLPKPSIKKLWLRGYRLNIIKTTFALSLLIVTSSFFEKSQPLLDYLEYLPVYRAELIYAR